MSRSDWAGSEVERSYKARGTEIQKEADRINEMIAQYSHWHDWKVKATSQRATR